MLLGYGYDMNIIFGNYGNETIALVQHCLDKSIPIAQVVSVDTEWAGKGFIERVLACEKWLREQDINVVRLKSKAGFSTLMRQQANFPSTKFQWCAGFLKGLPFLDWLDDVDPKNISTILLPKFRQKSSSLVDLPEHIEESEHYGERQVWHPMLELSASQIQELVQKTPIIWLAHRSLECDPCVNNTLVDFRRLVQVDINKTVVVENSLEKTMFAPESYSDSHGAEAVVRWAKKQDNTEAAAEENFSLGCGSPFSCGS